MKDGLPGNVESEFRNRNQEFRNTNLKEEYTMKKTTTGFYTEETLKKFATAYKDAIDEVKNGRDKITISKGNSKMGIFPSVSLLPFLTCPSTCKGTCGKYCYAAKLSLLRPSVLKSYARNTAVALLKPEKYFEQVDKAAHKSKAFRPHVSGDFMSPEYLGKMFDVSENNKGTKFLSFSKRFEWCNDIITERGLPGNYHLLFSGEKNLKPINPHNLPETIVVEPGMVVQENWILCGGNCQNCCLHEKGCMGAKPGDVIAFKKH